MICNNCGQNVADKLTYCPHCGGAMPYLEPVHNSSEPSFNPSDNLKDTPVEVIQKPKVQKVRSIISTIFLIIIFGSGLYNFISEELWGTDAEQAGQVIQDALNGTNESAPGSDEYVALMSQIMEYYKSESTALVALDNKLLNDDFLQPSSFVSRQTVRGYIKDMDAYIKEVERLQASQSTLKANALNLILTSSLSESEKQTARTSFESTANNQALNDAVDKRLTDLTIWAKSVRDLYSFIDSVYGNYEVVPDEAGNNLVAFYKTTDTDLYILLANKVDENYLKFSKSDQEYRTIANQYLGSMVDGVKIEDFEEYYYR